MFALSRERSEFIELATRIHLWVTMLRFTQGSRALILIASSDYAEAGGEHVCRQLRASTLYLNMVFVCCICNWEFRNHRNLNSELSEWHSGVPAQSSMSTSSLF